MANHEDAVKHYFQIAMQRNEKSSTLFERAREYEEIGFTRAAPALREAAERVERIEKFNQG
jgi:hypothetical protein